MCQCVMIVMVFVCEFELIIVDEFMIVFDVMVQVQILLLLKCLIEELNVVFLFIMYDFGVVVCYVDCVVVMYGGWIVEVVLVFIFYVQFKYFYM